MGINMKIAVMADVHSNSVALRGCVEYALEQGADTFFFLGDYVGEMAYPRRTMDILYALHDNYRCYFIRGNKEEYWLKYRDGQDVEWKAGSSTTGMLFYDYSNLRECDLDFFAGLPHTCAVSLEGMPALTLCHGSPRRISENLRPGDQNTFEVLEEDSNALVLCAHTHVQMRVEHRGKRLLNPGAVGLSLPVGGKAQFLLLQDKDGDWQEEFVSLDYDVEEVIAQLYEEGLDTMAPGWTKVTIDSLRGRQTSHARALGRVMELCREGEGACSWPHIPEKYWRRMEEENFGRELDFLRHGC